MHSPQSSSAAVEREAGRERSRIPYRVAFARGLLALSLGFAMLVQPDKSSDTLAHYMGVFWTLIGIVSIRSALAGRPTRPLPLVSGIVSTAAGLLTLLSALSGDAAAKIAAAYLLGIVIMLTGLAHVYGGFNTGDEYQRQRSRASLLLGLVEIALGLLFLVGSLENSAAIFWAAGGWAFLGGIILVGDALRMRRVALEKPSG